MPPWMRRKIPMLCAIEVTSYRTHQRPLHIRGAFFWFTHALALCRRCGCSCGCLCLGHNGNLRNRDSVLISLLYGGERTRRDGIKADGESQELGIRDIRQVPAPIPAQGLATWAGQMAATGVGDDMRLTTYGRGLLNCMSLEAHRSLRAMPGNYESVKTLAIMRSCAGFRLTMT